jgi:hypothetical protein
VTTTEVPADWRSRATVDVPVAGLIVGLSRNSAYAAAGRGELPSIVLGARKVVPVAALRRLLGELPEVGVAS